MGLLSGETSDGHDLGAGRTIPLERDGFRTKGGEDDDITPTQTLQPVRTIAS